MFYLHTLYTQAPLYHLVIEGLLLVWVFWLLLRKPNTRRSKLTFKVPNLVLIAFMIRVRNGIFYFSQEEEELIADWRPESLVPSNQDPNHPALSPLVIEGKVYSLPADNEYAVLIHVLIFLQAGKHVIIQGNRCLNLATHNYLGLVENQKIEESTIECMNKYGVGSCGPRGFYGTVGNSGNCLILIFKLSVQYQIYIL